jgi:hypothetical protein
VVAGALSAAALAGGCVERTLQIQSEPPGALVYLNGEEAGRTPMRRDFLWYGTYDVQLRKEGYVTKTEETRVWAPWWQIPPIDLLAEVIPLPLRDTHSVNCRLRPVTERQTDPEQLIERAAQMRGRLRSGENTREPGKRAAKDPK